MTEQSISSAEENTTGIDASKWGPPIWEAFHWVAAGFSSHPSHSEREHYRTYFNKFPFVLPCEECKFHAIQLMKKMPPIVDGRDRMFAWSVTFHNEVNKRIGNAEVTLQDARSRYGLPVIAQNVINAQIRSVTPLPVKSNAVSIVSSGSTSNPPSLRYSAPKAWQPPAIQTASKNQKNLPTVQNRSMGYNNASIYRPTVNNYLLKPAASYTAPKTVVPTFTTNHRTVPIKGKCNCGKK